MSTNQYSASECAKIEEVIKRSITWAMTKDKDALLRSFVHEPTLFFFSPDNAGNIRGYEQFVKMVDDVFMNPSFRALGSEFKELTINLSQSADVAWWSCFLDDFNEWQGRASNWENVRWTGVLGKREGQWVIMQMHFSYAVEQMRK